MKHNDLIIPIPIGEIMPWQTPTHNSTSQSQISSVVRYIARQEVHHKHKTFHEEYLELLEKFHITYERKYTFDLEE